MAVMGGAAYQILLQSKLLVTALIMWVLRGQRQSTLQWNVLVTIALGMSAFVLAEDSSNQARACQGQLALQRPLAQRSFKEMIQR